MKKYKLTQQEINALENKAYLQGYEKGLAEGEQRATFKKYTINDIRAMFDMPPLAQK